MMADAAFSGFSMLSLPILLAASRNQLLAISGARCGGVTALGMGALGSALGIGVAGQAAAGAWAKEARAGPQPQLHLHHPRGHARSARRCTP